MRKYKILSSFLLVILLYVWVTPCFATDSLMESDSVPAPPALELSAKGAILMDADTGEVLYRQNDLDALYPASTTKIMTCYLALQYLDVNASITIPEGINTGITDGASTANLKVGEELTVYQLLQCLMIVSANEAANAVAILVSGSIPDFVDLMNQEAAALGCTNTHFSNTNGLPAADHYSSAYDIALMSQELLSYPEILSYLSAESGTIEVGKEGHTSVIEMINTNKLLKTYNGATGIKTGFTQDAGYCLASSAERDDLRLIAVVLGAETSQLRFSESSRLLDYGFANYEAVKIADKNEIIGTAGVEKGFLNAVDIKTDEKIVLLVKKGEASAISYRVKPAENLKAPVNENDEAGTLEVTKDDETIGEYKLTASTDVRKADFKTLIIRSTEQILKG